MTSDEYGAKPSLKLTSTEAAALILSEGRTTDPQLAETYVSSVELDIEALKKSGLRREMGFDFQVKMRPNYLLCLSKQSPYVHTKALIKPGEVDEYGNIISPELIDRLVAACLRLKVKWDKETGADVIDVEED